jgi:hypothetical protein
VESENTIKRHSCYVERGQARLGFTMEKNHVDEIMSHMQVASKQAALVGFGPLPMRMGVVGSRSGLREAYEVPALTKKAA